MDDMKPAVFLDRDGTINEEMGYINHPDRFVLLPGVGRAIRRLNDAGLPVVVVTNQPGVARGLFPEGLVSLVNERMGQLLARDGAKLDGVYYCPHHPRGELTEYRRICPCRKPQPGMLIKAARDLDLDLKKSFVVGDRSGDLKTARQIGAKAVLVLTGYGKGEMEFVIPEKKVRPDFVAQDLGQAADWILETAGAI